MNELPLAPDWTSDILGPEYQRRTFDLGTDPDGEGSVIATLVRHRPSSLTLTPDTPAMVFVHGMSDYFFLNHVAEFFTSAGWAVYAIDLRKCGRSWREGQRWHHTSELKYYFPDFTVALDEVSKQHNKIIFNGHSTGALALVLWFDHIRRTDPDRHRLITGAILNSPWFEMMYSRPKVRFGTWVYNILGKIRPEKQLHHEPVASYGRSLHHSELGDWDYNLTYKPLGGQPKNNAWLRTVLLNQRRIHHGDIECALPLLVLCSTESWLRPEFSEHVHTADGVLDVHQIRRWAHAIGGTVTVEGIAGAKHDVYLSRPEPLAAALHTSLAWATALIDAPPTPSTAE
ncbi:MAG: alpha/beta hydrolase [Corynebacterium sp.]|nr:alpha/beta hydrolase [Corynebacterium sp.]